MNSLDYSPFFISTPEGKPRVSAEGIQFIEEPVRKKVESILKKEFTEEQVRILKSLLFFLKREKALGINFTEKNKSIVLKDKNGNYVGTTCSSDGLPLNQAISNQTFEDDLNLKGNGAGILSYIKLAMLISLQGKDILHSSHEEDLNEFSRKIWKRLIETGLAQKTKNRRYKFVDFSFLTKEDFDGILEEEYSAKKSASAPEDVPFIAPTK